MEQQTDQSTIKQPHPSRGGMIQATRILALGNITSKVFGLVRDMVITRTFGSTLGSSYDAAVLIPNTLFEMVRGGIVDSALVPIFGELAAEEDREPLWSAVSAFLSMLLVALVVAIVVLELAYKPVATAVGIYRRSDAEATVQLMRLAIPALLFLGSSSVLVGLLYALKRFTIPAFLPAVFNGSIIVAGLLYPQNIRSLVIGLMIGALLQVVVQLPMLRDARLRLHFDYKHPIIRRVLKLYAPIVGGLIINQTVILFSYNLAGSTGDQSLNYMQRATTLMQFPIGLIVTATSVAILPTLAQQSADHATFKITLTKGINLVAIFILPASMGLFILARPIVNLLFGYGLYTPSDVTQTANVLRIYVLGLPFAAIDQMLVFASYAKKDTLRPSIVGIISMGIYTIVALATVKPLGLFCLMVADAVKHVSHTMMMLVVLHPKIGSLNGYGILPTIGKAIFATAVMGAAAYFTQQFITTLALPALLDRLVPVAAAGGIGVLIYIVFVFIFDLREAKEFFKR